LRLYEAMFVVDSNRSRQDHEKVIEELSAIIIKGGGEVVNCDKWEERKLAYPVNRHRRATYYLSHFRAPGDAIPRIERAAQLSEAVIRVLVTLDDDGEAFPVFAELSESGPRSRRHDSDSRGSDRNDSRRPAAAAEKPAATEEKTKKVVAEKPAAVSAEVTESKDD